MLVTRLHCEVNSINSHIDINHRLNWQPYVMWCVLNHELFFFFSWFHLSKEFFSTAGQVFQMSNLSLLFLSVTSGLSRLFTWKLLKTSHPLKSAALPIVQLLLSLWKWCDEYKNNYSLQRISFNRPELELKVSTVYVKIQLYVRHISLLFEVLHIKK